MAKKHIISALILFIFVTANGQYWKNTRQELYFGLGPSNYFGDIGGAADEDNLYGLRDIQLLGTRPSLYGGFRYKIIPALAVRPQLSISVLSGDDSGSKNEGTRDFSFNSTIIAMDFLLEYSIIRDNIITTRYSIMNLRHGIRKQNKILNVYVFSGVSFGMVKVFANDKLEAGTMATGTGYTEEVKLSGSNLSIPVGVGTKIALNKRWLLGFEGGVKYSLDDYLDGYTSSISTANDMFYFSVVSLTYKIYRKPKF